MMNTISYIFVAVHTEWTLFPHRSNPDWTVLEDRLYHEGTWLIRLLLLITEYQKRIHYAILNGIKTEVENSEHHP